ncbi:MAG: FkbM family methyltransferase [Gemmatimonadota bacterium]
MTQSIRRWLKPLFGRTGLLWRCIPAPRLRYRVFRDRVDLLLYSLSISFPDIRFLQLGANDGTGFLEPFLRLGHWTGVLVEPVPYLFARLDRRYGSNSRLALEHAAVATDRTKRPFHYFAIGTTGLDGADQLGSFSYERVRAHCRGRPLLEASIVTEEISAVTLPELFRKHALAPLHLLQMDLEGYDYEVLRSLDLANDGAVLILYEHCLLKPADQEAARQLLHRSGYDTLVIGQDTAALRRNAGGHLRQSWKLLHD